ncbi:MAG: hypothetical protein IJH48_09385 [Oscillospiraceae bacterium]|nr:hypothetical protein [Oscillospiraceae bacterium]
MKKGVWNRMRKRLFLTGPSGCGKSTMIRAALGEKLAEAGGFVTERRSADDGRVLGYELLPSAAAGGIEGFVPLRFLDYTSDPPTRDNEIFRCEAVRLLQEAEYYPFAVLDEIGGFELVIPQFRAQLAAFLSSPVPCVGVLKDRRGVRELQERFGLGEKYAALAARLREALENDPETLVMTISEQGDENVRQALREWAAAYT